MKNMKRRPSTELSLELGWWEADKFILEPHCLDLLKAIEEELAYEDPMQHKTRKLISTSEAIQKNILPVLIHSHESPNIFRAVLRVLLRLTTPVECLIPIDLALQSAENHAAIGELHKLLLATKQAFLDVRSTDALVKLLKSKMKQVRLVDKLGSLLDQEKKQMSVDDLEGLSNSLVLMRNLLHVPDKAEAVKFGITEEMYEDWLNVHNKLIWNLFVHGLDGVLILMLNSEYKVNWAVVVVQIIALLYKDQDVGNLQHLISNSTSTSESSEDDIESNTSKHSIHHTSSNDSVQQHPTLANKFSTANIGGSVPEHSIPQSMADSGYSQSDFTSSSNNSRSFSPRDKMELSKDPSTSSGRASADNMTSSSNDDNSDEDNTQVKEHVKDHHHKASSKHRAMHSADSPSGSDSSNEDDMLARSKQRSLVAMSRKSKSGLKGGKCTPSVCLEAAVVALESRSALRDPVWDRKKTLVLLDSSAHVPSNEDISNILQSFTVSFLHSGYSSLVMELMKVNQEKGASLIDRCHFLWLVGYFTGLATAVGLSFHHIKPVLSVEVVGLLVFEAISVCNELDLKEEEQCAEKSKLLKKRYHLVVRAFREFITAIGTYNSRCKGVGEEMRKLCVSLARLEDLRNIPLLLIRKWATMPSHVLVDLIITNHLLLLILEYAQNTEDLDIDILSHLSQFATTEVMEKYGEVLKDFRTNSTLVNDCVFTMMHHVAGDLKRPEALFHPSILSCFVNILNEGAEIPELYEDLVGYVMNRYLKLAGKNPELYGERLPGMQRGAGSASSTQPFVHPFYYDEESSDSSESDLDETDLDNPLYWCFLQFEYDSDPVGQIVEHLKRNEVRCTRREILDQLKYKRVISITQCDKLEEKEKQFLENSEKTRDQPEEKEGSETSSEITDLVLKLKGLGYESQLQWLQKKLLEVCYVKLKRSTTMADAEPVALHYTLLGQSVPIVAFSELQSLALRNADFFQLLQKLGLHFPVPGQCPYIPCSWEADKLYATARKLGPLSMWHLKFNSEDLDNSLNSEAS
ncbi:protein timeless-like isoform X2 [Ornithodoros turicata]|uniref:protein timeless-like isoform X2 n=1 Tax=Ornithodoros turicata TaxID=34597 RepID=UPI0031390E81